MLGHQRWTIPGDKVYHNEYTDRHELRLEDRSLYGRTTKEDRDEILNRLNEARRIDTEANRKALAEARADSRIAHAYVMGIFDTCKHLFSTPQFEAVLEACWNFSTEVEYASYMFHTERSSGKYGYGTAWEVWLRYNPQVDAILGRVVIAARSL